MSWSWCASNAEQHFHRTLPTLGRIHPGQQDTCSSTTCVSNIPGCCFQHLLGDANPPAANEPGIAMEPGLQRRMKRCPPFCPVWGTSWARANLAAPAPPAVPGVTMPAGLLRSSLPVPICCPTNILSRRFIAWFVQATF